jgi:YVTN family beta-propeller protein
MKWNAFLKVILAGAAALWVSAAHGQVPITNIATKTGPPTAIAINPTTNRLYIVEGAEDALLEVDERSMETVEFPLRPSSLSGQTEVHVNPNLNRIYVSNYMNAYVAILNRFSTTQPVSFIATKEGPLGLAINRWTNKVYMSQPTSNAVAILDEAHGSLKYVKVGNHPGPIAVDEHTNKIYVANESGSSVSVIDGVTEKVTNVPVGNEPLALAVDEVRNIVYVADVLSSDVTIIDGATLTKQTVTGVPSPYAIAINTVTNKIYVATQNSGVVGVINGASHGLQLLEAGTFVYNFSVDSVRNKIYTVDPNTNQIYIIDGETNAVTAVPGTGILPEKVIVNPLSNVFYGMNRGSSDVTVFAGGPAFLPYSIYRLF